MTEFDPTLAFFSDNTSAMAPELLAAIDEANRGVCKSYGDDPWTLKLDEAFSAWFGSRVKVFVVTTGTAANALALSTLSPPYGCVYAHDGAHVIEDECGAVEFFSGGARLKGVPGEAGRMTPEALAQSIGEQPVSVHTVQPAAITLTQATELGTAYRPDDIAALSAVARRHGLKVHVDGARFANALAFLGCHPGDITWRAGVDALSFGATKNGALATEAVVFFDPAAARDFELRRKRAGHLLSKSRFASAQLLAYLNPDVWLRNARHANRLARRIGEAAGALLLHPVEANEVFLNLGSARKEKLRAAGFGFYDWGSAASGEARFVTSWNQDEAGVERLCQALQ